MDNLIKIPSNQSIFDVGAGATQGLVDIILPEGPVYNLNESFINVNITSQSICTADANAVYNNFITFNGDGSDTKQYPDPVVIVKHAHARGQKVGKIEDLRNVNLLRHNLAIYKKNLAEQRDDINGLMANNVRSVYKPQPQNELYGFGGNDGGLSRSRSHDVRLPLRDIFNFCRTEAYDSSKYGALHLHFELDNTRLGAGVETINDYGTLTKFGTAAGNEFNEMEVIEGGGVVGAGGSKQLRTKNEYRDLQDAAYYTNMPVICNRVKDGAGATNSGTLRIVNISYDTATPSNKLILELSDVWTDGAATYTAPKLNIDATRSANNISINNIEAAVVVNNDGKGQGLNYSTFSSQDDTYDAAINNLNRNYEIPANTKNIYIMFNTNGNIVSNDANLDHYRITLDGEEITNRKVRVLSPLHYELLNQVFLNNGEAIHNLGEKLYTLFNSKARGQVTTQQNFIIAIPCRFLPRPQRLGLVLEHSGASSGRHVIYSEVIKQL